MTAWKYLEMAKNGTKFKTKCGFDVKIYEANYNNACSTIHGAVLVPHDPATFGGWTMAEWHRETGVCLYNKQWDLVEIKETRDILTIGSSHKVSITQGDEDKCQLSIRVDNLKEAFDTVLKDSMKKGSALVIDDIDQDILIDGKPGHITIKKRN